MADAVKVVFKNDADDGLARLEQRVREDYLFSTVAAMARVIYEEVLLNVTVESRQGIGRVTGNLASSIYRTYVPEQSTPQVKFYRVSWNKKTAPHGHLLEFGTSKAPAYPFIRPSLAHLPAAIDAGIVRLSQRFGGSQ